jgi:hypothetical protein
MLRQPAACRSSEQDPCASLLDNEIKILEQDSKRINGEKRNVEERIKENNEKIKLNKQVCRGAVLVLACSVGVC